MRSTLKILSPEQEIAFMRRELKMEAPVDLMNRIVGHFTVLQTRAGMMLSLVTICLTISGFSGHRIAAAGLLPASLLAGGVFLVVSAAAILFSGPLRLRWATQHACDEGLDSTLIAMLRLRNYRTRRYHLAGSILFLGLACYMGAVVLFVLMEGFAA